MRRNIIHILAWLLVVLVLFTYRSLYSFDLQLNTTLVFTATDTMFLFLSALTINHWIIPQLLYKKRTLLFILALAALFYVYVNIIQFIQLRWFRFTGTLPAASEEVFHKYTYQMFNTWIVIFLGGMAIFLTRIANDQRLAQRRYDDLKREKAETELDFLKAQINPHFLFNSINSIYGNIDKSNTAARDILLKFSEMLRYQLYECNGHRISMIQEIRYLQNYVELQKLRKEENLGVQLHIDNIVKKFDIAPLVLIPFVENAFKYVSNFEHKPNRIDIFLGLSGERLTFNISNTKDHHATQHVLHSKGIGIQNVKRRLELLYPGNHELTINAEANVFEVQLKLSTR